MERKKQPMKRIYILTAAFIMILAVSTATLLVSYTPSGSSTVKDPVYVGIAFGGNTTEQAKILIDKTKNYTNLFVLDCGINAISLNRSAVEEICQYATDAGLKIIVNLGTYTRQNWDWQNQLFIDIKNQYGEQFLGTYYDDEPGGVPLDWNWTREFAINPLPFGANFTEPIKSKIQTAIQTGQNPSDYSVEAQWFKEFLTENPGHRDLISDNIATFTSDYALYWFDYIGGYDTMFAQLGWNESVNRQISLVRGAAQLQGKDWGTIITWKYMQPPYIDTADNVYDQMVTSFNAGAKYITIFDYPYNVTGNPYGILTDEHFQALERFWNQVATKATPNSAVAQAALVLPKDYGSGLRSATDKIWGVWGPDDKSAPCYNNIVKLLNEYGFQLDIVYDDPAYPLQGNYSRVYYWNQTIT
ncbi:MAG: hypothetical protein ACQCN6_07315 [Candidatus Bathyarchaeia archaeon]